MRGSLRAAVGAAAVFGVLSAGLVQAPAAGALAIGFADSSESLPEKLWERDLAQRTRKSLNEFVYSKAWGTAFTKLELR